VTLWTLILTFSQWGNHGVAIASITGFPSQRACTTAGNLWMKEQERSTQTANAVCVEVQK